MPENALLWCWSLSSLSGKLPALRRDSRTSQIDCNQIQVANSQQQHQQQQAYTENNQTFGLGGIRGSQLKGAYSQSQHTVKVVQGSGGYPLSEKELAKESIYSRVSKPPRDRQNDKNLGIEK
ncbi:hypothetical protein BIW11_09575, partial [Tropilaelaps mercedesae]